MPYHRIILGSLMIAAAATADPQAEAPARGGETEIFVRPGVTADRAAGRVVIEAEATGLTGGSTVEFFLVGSASGHDYEALAVTQAKPGDVCRALAFIGLPPGRPVDPPNNVFWPRGERVTMAFRRQDASETIPVERLLRDTQGRKEGERMTFVFVAGPREEQDDGTVVYAVDSNPPIAIAANYNERFTVLDVPAQAPQSEVYNTQLANPELTLREGEKLEVIVEPRFKDRVPRAVDLGLRVTRPSAADASAAHALHYVMTGPSALELPSTDTITAVLKAFAGLTERGYDPFVSLAFGPRVPIGQARDVCGLLQTIESDRGIRIEPPAAGQLYYRAFLPNLSLVPRDKRMAQPWELHWSQGDAPVTLIQCKETWLDQKPKPELTLIPHVPENPADAARMVAEHGHTIPALLVFAPPQVTYGELMHWVEPLRAKLPYIHVVNAAPGRAPGWRPALMAH